ncbi:hypothetical protein ACETK8_07355 [Brevundimonas staleyi]|uniref:DUF4190 domain-containing protein n=1 Tax=Brevundimonas staleyi TaxID=74326 RepID=A0ABW0FNM8_9CAUL
MGGKRSPIRSTAPRWRPGRYKPRSRARIRKEGPFRPVEDTLIAIGASLVAALIVLCLAVPIAATYRIPVFLSFGVIMTLLTAMTYRLGGKGQAGRIMAGIMAGVCALVFGILFLARDQLQFGPHDHAKPAPISAAAQR